MPIVYPAINSVTAKLISVIKSITSMASPPSRILTQREYPPSCQRANRLPSMAALIPLYGNPAVRATMKSTKAKLKESYCRYDSYQLRERFYLLLSPLKGGTKMVAKSSKRNVLIMIVLAIFTATMIFAVTPQAASAAGKYNKYKGTWVTAASHRYVATLKVKKLTKAKIKGTLSIEDYGDPYFGFTDKIKINKKIKIKKNKFKFKAKSKKGYKVTVYVKLGKKSYWSKYDMYKGIKIKTNSGAKKSWGQRLGNGYIQMAK